MNALVLIPKRNGLSWARIAIPGSGVGADASSEPRGTVDDLRAVRIALAERHDEYPIDVISIWVLYGGEEFSAPVLVDEASQQRLLRLGPQAPLSVAKTRALIERAQALFPGIPIALVFETSFFLRLPARETTYALPGDSGLSARRWGWHGIFHDAATRDLARTFGRREGPARMLSICLDASPEIAAILGRTPQFVTSGSTPVEGLPGERNCGEIDPSIPLALAADKAIGPEKANILLTQQSGFFGMLGKPATLGEILAERRPTLAKVRGHLLYRMALAAGSSMAALGELDGVVFSGPYAAHADVVAAYLMPKIERTQGMSAAKLPWHVCSTSLEALVADAGLSALLAGRKPCPSEVVPSKAKRDMKYNPR